MSRDEIVENVISLLRDHQEGRLGSIHQEPYKRDLFALFAEAYNVGLMREGAQETLLPDRLTNIVLARAPEVVGERRWEEFCGFWREWAYAWDHAEQRRPLANH